jgi:hypothetical protein
MKIKQQTGCSGRAGYVNVTFCNSISPLNDDGFLPSSVFDASIFDI